MTHTVHCVKLDQQAEGLDKPPLPGDLGQRLYDNVSKEAWTLWLRHQTMLINENRLSIRNAEHRKYLTEQVERFFFGDGGDDVAGYVPKS